MAARRLGTSDMRSFRGLSEWARAFVFAVARLMGNAGDVGVEDRVALDLLEAGEARVGGADGAREHAEPAEVARVKPAVSVGRRGGLLGGVGVVAAGVAGGGEAVAHSG